MRLLAIDTSTLTASVALVDVHDRVHVIASEEVDTSASHSERLLPAIAAVLERAGVTLAALDALAVGAGPGSFTGLRIGLATAKGLAFAAGKPLWLASSLGALAWELAAAAPAGALLVPVLDARRGEIYAGFYRRGDRAVTAVSPERVMAPGALAQAIADATADGGDAAVAIAGDALGVHADALVGLPPTVLRPAVRATPPAAGVAAMAAAGDRTDAIARGAPAYIRPSEAEVKYPDGVPGALRKA